MSKLSSALELNPVTETVQAENTVVISPEAKSTFQEKIVERKTIVYETLVDPAVIKIAAENLKDQLFTKYGFLRPAPDEVTLVSIEKSYEPFIVITGKYAIDYYRKRTVAFAVDDAVSGWCSVSASSAPNRSRMPLAKRTGESSSLRRRGCGTKPQPP
jgi:hypothetical protein